MMKTVMSATPTMLAAESDYFDAGNWLGRFNRTKPRTDERRDLLKEIWIGTKKVLRKEWYWSASGKITLRELLILSRQEDVPKGERRLSYLHKVDPSTDVISAMPSPKLDVQVKEGDSIDVAMDLRRREGLNPVVLNMANDKVPGGGYLRGAAAQEESLFRRSNYSELLTEEFYGKDGMPEFGGIYTPNVLVFRESQQNGYAFSEQPEFVHFVAAAAYNLGSPGGVTKKMDNAKQRDMRLKIRAVLHIAEYHGHNAIILGAWGCGAFSNPPKVVAKLFRDELFLLTKGGRTTTLKAAHFAIFDDANALKNSSEGNVAVFRRVFDKW